jgi:hypothetical protein
MTSIHERQSARARFLRELYDQTDGNRLKSVDRIAVGNSVGLDVPMIEGVVRHLVDGGLIEQEFGGGVKLTPRGIFQVEMDAGSEADEREALLVVLTAAEKAEVEAEPALCSRQST